MITVKILCMECDFEGEVCYEDPNFEVTHCPCCGSPIEYHEEKEYDDDEMDLSE